MSSNLKLFNSQITNPRTQEYLQSVLSDKKASFVNNLTSLVANNTKLQECEPMTLMYAGIKATALNLPLDSNLGFAYVIPYNNRKEGKVEAQFQMGYKGYIQLAIRSGQFVSLNVTDVREGEFIDKDILTGAIKIKSVEGREKKKVIGYAAYFKLVNGFEKMSYATIEEVEKHAKRYSQTYGSKTDYIRNSSKWTTDFDAMAEKTVLKLLLSKYAPLSVEMQEAVSCDQSVITENGHRYVDNEETEEAVAEELNEEKEQSANKEEIDIQGDATSIKVDKNREPDMFKKGVSPQPSEKTKKEDKPAF